MISLATATSSILAHSKRTFLFKLNSLTIAARTAIQGGGTKGRRSVDELDLYIRDLEQQILYGRAAYAYPDGNGKIYLPNLICAVTNS